LNASGPERAIEISVCIVSRDRHNALGLCLSDLAGQSDPPPWEILVAADNDPATEEVVAAWLPLATIVHTAGLTLGANRNRLIDCAHGTLLLFLDDDTRLRPTLLHDLAEIAAAYPTTGVFGGPNLTPEDAPWFEQVQGRLLALPLLTGPMSHRYRQLTAPIATGGRGLTLCNLAVRRQTNARFPEHQRGGEECTLLQGLRAQGVLMLRHPALTVEHRRRPTLRAWSRQLYKYGHGRGEQLATSHPVAMRIGPLACVAFALRIRRGRYVLAATPLIAAASATGWLAVVERSYRPRDLLGTFTQAVAIPVTYGVGVMRGILTANPRSAKDPTG